MPLEGHWARQHAPLSARARRVTALALGLLAAAVLALLLIPRASAPAPGCVDVTIASTTGGAAVHACGERARRLCAAPHATVEIRAACEQARSARSR